MRQRTLAVFAVIPLLCSLSAGQAVNFYVITTVGGAPSMGYQGAVMSGGVGIEAASSRLFARTEGKGSLARKQQVGGKSAGGFAEAYLRLNRNFWAGGGISYSREFTRRWSKDAVHPRISAGYIQGRTRALVACVLPGTDVQNHVQGVQGEFALQMTPRVLWLTRMGFYGFHATGNPAEHHWGSDTSFGLQFRLNRTER